MGGGTGSGETFAYRGNSMIEYLVLNDETLFFDPEAIAGFEMNFTFDLDPHEYTLLYNVLFGPYDWAKELEVD